MCGVMEYRAEVNRDLEILELLESGNVVDASYRMRQHLSGALKRKSPLAWGWAAEAENRSVVPAP